MHVAVVQLDHLVHLHVRPFRRPDLSDQAATLPVPGFSSVSPPVYALIVAGGVIVLAVPPQIIHRMRRPSWSDDARCPDVDVI